MRIDRIESDNLELSKRISRNEGLQNGVDSLNDQISELVNKLEYNEFRDRKYNILINRIQEKHTPPNKI